MKIDLTKNRKMISHTIWPNGVRTGYLEGKIIVPVATQPPAMSWELEEGWSCGTPEYSQLEFTPREFSEYLKDKEK